jgi:hypothetical protein
MPALLVALAPIGCDLPDHPTGLPPLADVPVEFGVPARTEAVLVGSYTTPSPRMPPPGEITSSDELKQTPITLEPNSYFLVRIGGTLYAERNPFHPGTTEGAGAISYSAVESSLMTGRGQTHLRLYTGSPPGGLDYLSYFRPDANGRDLILLVRTGSAPADLWSHRDRMAGGTWPGWYCLADFPYCSLSETEKIAVPTLGGIHKWIEDYWLKQAHTITVTKIPEPLVLDGPAAVPPGGTATFTASAWGDLQLRERKSPGFPGVRWFWYPNDTTGIPPLPARSICWTAEPICHFEPKESGRLHAWSYVDGALVEANKIVRVQQQQLRLTCSRYSLDRGQTVNCSANASPSGTLDSIRWRFVDTAGHVIDSAGPSSWGGHMIVGGTITVQALLNGSPVADDTTITVRARRWPRPSVRAHEEPANDLPLPASVNGPHDLADSHVDSLPNPPLTTRKIDTGPNAGWWYILSTPGESLTFLAVENLTAGGG